MLQGAPPAARRSLGVLFLKGRRRPPGARSATQPPQWATVLAAALRMKQYLRICTPLHKQVRGNSGATELGVARPDFARLFMALRDCAWSGAAGCGDERRHAHERRRDAWLQTPLAARGCRRASALTRVRERRRGWVGWVGGWVWVGLGRRGANQGIILQSPPPPSAAGGLSFSPPPPPPPPPPRPPGGSTRTPPTPLFDRKRRRCLPACLPACLPVCLSVRLSFCLCLHMPVLSISPRSPCLCLCLCLCPCPCLCAFRSVRIGACACVCVCVPAE